MQQFNIVRERPSRSPLLETLIGGAPSDWSSLGYEVCSLLIGLVREHLIHQLEVTRQVKPHTYAKHATHAITKAYEGEKRSDLCLFDATQGRINFNLCRYWMVESLNGISEPAIVSSIQVLFAREHTQGDGSRAGLHCLLPNDSRVHRAHASDSPTNSRGCRQLSRQVRDQACQC